MLDAIPLAPQKLGSAPLISDAFVPGRVNNNNQNLEFTKSGSTVAALFKQF